MLVYILDFPEGRMECVNTLFAITFGCKSKAMNIGVLTDRFASEGNYQSSSELKVS